MIIRKELAQKWLAFESSPVDWCEENYAVSSHIAEFTNTISNILFVALPMFLIGANVWKSYNKYVCMGVYIQLFLLMFIGASSAYFHATLSLFGQLLDELAIIWSVLLGYSFFMPEWMRPRFFKGNSAHLIACVFALLLTGAWFVAPHLNAFFMMTLVVPVIYAQIKEIYSPVRRKPVHISVLSVTLVLMAVSVWIADRAMCGVWKSMKIPGLHSIWHVFMAVGAYLCLLDFSFLKVVRDNPQVKPSIRYSPGGTWGIPYVHCKTSQRIY